MMAWIFGTNYWENACRRLAFLVNIFILFPSSLFSMTRLILFFSGFSLCNSIAVGASLSGIYADYSQSCRK